MRRRQAGLNKIGRLQRSFRARHAFLARIGLDRHTDRPGACLEDRFGDMVSVRAVMQHLVQVAPGGVGKSLPEFADELRIEGADPAGKKGDPGNEMRASAKIDRYRNQGFVHR